MNFESIRGQDIIKNILTESVVSGRVNHAYMFCGADGIGKFSVAEGFASMLVCSAPDEEGRPCGKCEACILRQNGTNPDITVVDLPEGKSVIGVDRIRTVNEDVMTAPLYSARKVYIIRHADAMNAPAQNALLKTLEEPPAYVVIILLAANPSLMLDTIASRVIRLDMARYSREEIRQALEDRMIDPGDDEVVFSYADGIIGRAIEYYDDSASAEIRDELLNIVLGLKKGGVDFRMKAADRLSALKARKDFVFFTLLSYYRDIAALGRYGSFSKAENPGRLSELKEGAKSIGYYDAMNCIDIINKAWQRIRQNSNYELVTAAMLIEIQEVLCG